MIWRLLAERRIEEAMEEGVFDNLPHRGSTLCLDDDLHIPEEHRMAARVLKNSNTPPSSALLREAVHDARREAENTLQHLAAEYQRMAAAGSHHHKGLSEWRLRARATYRQQLEAVNLAVLKANMQAPFAAGADITVHIETALSRFDALLPERPHECHR
jgi:hypothetical protein